MNPADRTILRDLAKQYRDLCAGPVQDERRHLWRRHNITLKDVETVERDPNRVKEWVQITRAVVDEFFG